MPESFLQLLFVQQHWHVHCTLNQQETVVTWCTTHFWMWVRSRSSSCHTGTEAELERLTFFWAMVRRITMDNQQLSHLQVNRKKKVRWATALQHQLVRTQWQAYPSTNIAPRYMISSCKINCTTWFASLLSCKCWGTKNGCRYGDNLDMPITRTGCPNTEHTLNLLAQKKTCKCGCRCL